MNKRIILWVAIGILVLGLVFLTFFPGMINALKDSGKMGEDLCKPGQGYTEESWREHIGHHPKVYKDCLN